MISWPARVLNIFSAQVWQGTPDRRGIEGASFSLILGFVEISSRRSLAVQGDKSGTINIFESCLSYTARRQLFHPGGADLIRLGASHPALQA